MYPGQKLELTDEWPLYKEIFDYYNSNLVWQLKAKETMAKVLSGTYQDFSPKPWPLSVLFFKWPTWVGKTEITKITADFLFWSSNGIVRIDCDQLKQSHEDAVLFGAPPWYLWYKDKAKLHPDNVYAAYNEGQQYNKLHKIAKRRPNMNIIVFDEIEKAHPNIIQWLLKMMEEDYITLKDGTKVFLWNSIIIFTSNVWERDSQNTIKPVWFGVSKTDESQKKMEVKNEWFKKTFSPEFIWRLDHTLEFEPLQTNHLTSYINSLKQELLYEVLINTKNKLLLSYDANINNYIASKADTSKWFRNINKIWETEVRSKIATILKINSRRINNNQILSVEVAQDKIKIFLENKSHEGLVILDNDGSTVSLEDYKKNNLQKYGIHIEEDEYTVEEETWQEQLNKANKETILTLLDHIQKQRHKRFPNKKPNLSNKKDT